MSMALACWARLLRPGGRLVLVYQSTSHCWYENIWDMCYRVCPVVLGGCRGIAPEPLIRAVGFSVSSKDSVTRFGVPQEILVARSGR
jgi:hypothetical protein